MINISQRAAGERNVTFNIWGRIESLYSSDDIKVELGTEGLKLSSLVWLIEEKMGLYLVNSGGEIWIPMESRNSIRFDHGLPVKGNKLWLRAFCNSPTEESFKRSFFLILDFDK